MNRLDGVLWLGSEDTKLLKEMSREELLEVIETLLEDADATREMTLRLCELERLRSAHA
jgi:hypothetical protein